jgi:anti-sigma regulatory factor (Ser/Thr protein kinase)
VNEAPLQLTVPARPEYLAVIRQALAGVADALEVDISILNDMKVAVNEACTNVVVHAYPGGEGTLEVGVRPQPEEVTVIVRDSGVGVQPRSDPSTGVGFLLISSLSDRFEIRGGGDAGIEVRMAFRLDSLPDVELSAIEAEIATTAPGSPKSAGAVVSAVPSPVVSPVVSRLIGALATQADLTLDRLSDAQLVGEAISAHVHDYISGERICIAIEEADHRLDICIGPLAENGSDRLRRDLALPGADRSLEQLIDEVQVEYEQQANGADSKVEYLRLHFIQS